VKLGWKTLTGGLLVALGIAGSPAVLAFLPLKAAGIIEAAGALLAAIGVRHAIAKSKE